MKKLCVALSLLLFCICININTQAQNWEWAQSTGEGDGRAICTNAEGNIFVTGSLVNSAAFQNYNEDGPVILVKYDSSGNIIWAQYATQGNPIGQSVSADAFGNIYITGTVYTPTVEFGNTIVNNPHGNEMGAAIFLVKCSSTGNVLWAKEAGGKGYDHGQAVSTDASGNVYITGYFESPAITFGTTTLVNNDSAFGSDIFLVKYDSTGQVIWAKSAGGPDEDEAQGVSTDASGNAYITGYFESPNINFGNTTLTIADSTFSSSSVFIAKYDPSGNVIWAESAGGINQNFGQSISTNIWGDVYITGNFQCPLITFGNTTLSGTVFVVKYDSSGTLDWVRSSGLSRNAVGQSITTDIYGNAYVAGNFSDSIISFGDNTLVNVNSNPDTVRNDIFIVKYDIAGNVVWVKQAGGSLNDLAYGISTGTGGTVYLTGTFYSHNFSFSSYELTYTGVNDARFFIAKLGTTTNTGIQNEPPSSNTIQVYPNPSTGTFIFTGVQNNSTIQIYNVLGKLISSSITDNTNYRINLNTQAKGIYFYRVINNSNIIAQGKIVLE